MSATLTFVNVASWVPDQVVAWLTGLEGMSSDHVSYFSAAAVTGQQLLQLTNTDLMKLNVVKVGPQEKILQAISLLQSLQYDLACETLQSISLQISCLARNLCGLVKSSDDRWDAREQIETLQGVSDIVNSTKKLIQWIDWMMRGKDRMSTTRAELINLLLQFIFLVRENMLCSASTLVGLCKQLWALCDGLVTDSKDSLHITPASLELISLHKKPDEELGMSFISSHGGIHTIENVKPGSAADASGRLAAGDIIIQVNYQTVMGWEASKLVGLIKDNSKTITLTIKKCPHHISVTAGYNKNKREGVGGAVKQFRTSMAINNKRLSANHKPLINSMPDQDIEDESTSEGEEVFHKEVVNFPTFFDSDLKLRRSTVTGASIKGSSLSDLIDISSSSAVGSGAAAIPHSRPKSYFPQGLHANKAAAEVNEISLAPQSFTRDIRTAPKKRVVIPSATRPFIATDPHSVPPSSTAAAPPLESDPDPNEQNSSADLSSLPQAPVKFSEHSPKLKLNKSPRPHTPPLSFSHSVSTSLHIPSSSSLDSPTLPLGHTGGHIPPVSLLVKSPPIFTFSSPPANAELQSHDQSSKVKSVEVVGRNSLSTSSSCTESQSASPVSINSPGSVQPKNADRYGNIGDSEVYGNSRSYLSTSTRNQISSIENFQSARNCHSTSNSHSAGNTHLSVNTSSADRSNSPSRGNLPSDSSSQSSSPYFPSDYSPWDLRVPSSSVSPSLASLDIRHGSLVSPDPVHTPVLNLEQPRRRSEAVSHYYEHAEDPMSPRLIRLLRVDSRRRAEMSQQSRKEKDSVGESDQGGQNFTIKMVGGVPQKLPKKFESNSPANSPSRKTTTRKGVSRRISCKDLGGGDCQGWLWKKKEGAGLRPGKWVKCWFVLHLKHLYYFTDPEDLKAQGVLELPGFTVSPTQESRSKKFAFKVYNSQATFYFAAERQDDMAKWMNKMALASLGNFVPGSLTSHVKTTGQGHHKPSQAVDPLPYFSESDEDFLNSPLSQKKTPPASESSSREDLTDLYRRIRGADLDISGANLKQKRSTLLASKSFAIKRLPPGCSPAVSGGGCQGGAGVGVGVGPGVGVEVSVGVGLGVGEEDAERERTFKLLCLKRTLKDKEQTLEAITKLLSSQPITATLLGDFSHSHEVLLTERAHNHAHVERKKGGKEEESPASSDLDAL